MFDEYCDECGELCEKRYIRVQQWDATSFDETLERVFCSAKCMKKYTKDW